MKCPNCGASIKPSLAFCVECGQPVSPTSRADNYRPTPPPWPVSGREEPLPPPTPSRPVGVPWEDKTRGSLLDRLVDTTRRVLSAPTDFFRSITTGTGNYLDPLGYSVILQSLAGWVGIVYGLVIERTMGAFVPTVPSQYAPFVGPLIGAVGLTEAIIGAILIPVIAAVGVLVSAGILHLVLLLLGGARNGFEGTMKVVCYVAGAAALLTIVPFCGRLLIFPLTLFLEIIGISEVHRISRGKAAVAVLLPVFLCCCLCFGVGMVVAVAVPSLIGSLGQ